MNLSDKQKTEIDNLIDAGDLAGAIRYIAGIVPTEAGVSSALQAKSNAATVTALADRVEALENA